MLRRSKHGIVGRWFRLVALATVLSGLATGTSQAQFSPSPPDQQIYVTTRSVNDAVMGNAQSNLLGVRDGLQRLLRPNGGGAAVAFSGERQSGPWSADNNPFNALAYAKAPAKGPQAAPPSYFISVWGQGSHDRERRTTDLNGTSTAGTTWSNTAVLGLDYVKIGVAQATDAFVIGVFGSETSTRSFIVPNNFGEFASSRSVTGGGGIYASYINGGLSTDFTLVISGTGTNLFTTVLTHRETDSWNAAFNIQYKWDLPANWWVEPTIGFSANRSHMDARNTVDGFSRRMQGGVRTGTEFAFGSVKVQPTLAGYVYSDVNNEVIHPNGFVFFVNNDKGYLWTKGVGKLNVQWTDKFSTSVEGELRHRPDVDGYAGRVMARYTF